MSARSDDCHSALTTPVSLTAGIAGVSGVLSDGRVPESSAVFHAQREAGSSSNLHTRAAVSAFDRVLRTELRRSVGVDVGVDALPAPEESQAAEHVVLRGGKDAGSILKRRVQDGQITWGEA